MAEDFAMEIRKIMRFTCCLLLGFGCPRSLSCIFSVTHYFHNLSHTYIDINGGHYKRGNGTSPGNVDACRMGTTSCLFNLVSS